MRKDNRTATPSFRSTRWSGAEFTGNIVRWRFGYITCSEKRLVIYVTRLCLYSVVADWEGKSVE